MSVTTLAFTAPRQKRKIAECLDVLASLEVGKTTTEEFQHRMEPFDRFKGSFESSDPTTIGFAYGFVSPRNASPPSEPPLARMLIAVSFNGGVLERVRVRFQRGRVVVILVEEQVLITAPSPTGLYHAESDGSTWFQRVVINPRAEHRQKKRVFAFNLGCFDRDASCGTPYEMLPTVNFDDKR